MLNLFLVSCVLGLVAAVVLDVIGYASAMAVVLLGIILIVSLVQLKVGKQDWEY